MQYDLIEDSDYRSFLERVRAALQQGWYLHGPTQALVMDWGNGQFVHYIQAVTKDA